MEDSGVVDGGGAGDKKQVKFSKRGEHDVVVKSGDKDVRLEDYTRRRNKVHILVPTDKNDALILKVFKKPIDRIKIVFKNRGSLKTHLSGENIKKIKINNRMFKVTRKTKLGGLKELILTGKLIPAYQGEDENEDSMKLNESQLRKLIQESIKDLL